MQASTHFDHTPACIAMFGILTRTSVLPGSFPNVCTLPFISHTQFPPRLLLVIRRAHAHVRFPGASVLLSMVDFGIQVVRSSAVCRPTNNAFLSQCPALFRICYCRCSEPLLPTRGPFNFALTSCVPRNVRVAAGFGFPFCSVSVNWV